jgi:SAM-dependent methyltransferase
MSPPVAHGLPLTRKLNEGFELSKQYRAAAAPARISKASSRRSPSTTPRSESSPASAGRGAGFRDRIRRPAPSPDRASEHGVDERGVDAEVPVVPGRPSQFVHMLHRNGVERAAKSLIRHILFDRGEHRELDRALRERGFVRRLDPARLIVADARDVEIEPGTLDLVISEDVFEHLQRDTLEQVIAAMARWLKPTGIALIRPNVFTGITVGHVIEWSRHAMRQPPPKPRIEPWDHLRQRRFKPNTYLNELTRAEYRDLFGVRFDILKERVTQPDLGREYLDARAQAELADWPKEELFSNQTLFVLRPRIGVN